MANDEHPADDIARAVMGIFNGDNIRQSIRDAWDRMHAPTIPDAAPKSDQKMNWTPQPNAEQQQDINKRNALDSVAASRIRTKAKVK